MSAYADCTERLAGACAARDFYFERESPFPTGPAICPDCTALLDDPSIGPLRKAGLLKSVRFSPRDLSVRPTEKRP